MAKVATKKETGLKTVSDLRTDLINKITSVTKAWSILNGYDKDNKAEEKKEGIKLSKKAEAVRRLLSVGDWGGHQPKVVALCSALLDEKIEIPEDNYNNHNIVNIKSAAEAKGEDGNGGGRYVERFLAIVTIHRNAINYIPANSLVLFTDNVNHRWYCATTNKFGEHYNTNRDYYRPANKEEIEQIADAYIKATFLL